MLTRRTAVLSLSATPALALQARPAVIDAHCHAGRGQALSAPWTTRADPELTLRRMQDAGIDRTIIFPINNQQYDQANAEIADICRRHPGKFIGFAKHDPQTEAGRITAMLRHEVQTLGLKGLKLHRLPTREVLDAVSELRVPILYHPEKVSNLHMIASEFPNVPFIVAHLGNFASHDWTEHIAAIEVARRYPNVYLETSSVVFQRFLEQAVREVGAGKLIFGSDGPELDSRVELYKVRLLKLSPDDEARVLGGNIHKLLPRGS
jgi:uncharacterized protein